MTIQAKLNKEVQSRDSISSFVRSLLGQEISSSRSLPRDVSLLPRSLPSLEISDHSRSLIPLPRKFQSSIPNNQITNNNTSSHHHFSSSSNSSHHHFSSSSSSNLNSRNSLLNTCNDVADTDCSDDTDSLNRSHCVDSCDGSDRDDCVLYGGYDRSDVDSVFGDRCLVEGDYLLGGVGIIPIEVLCVDNLVTSRVPLCREDLSSLSELKSVWRPLGIKRCRLVPTLSFRKPRGYYSDISVSFC